MAAARLELLLDVAKSDPRRDRVVRDLLTTFADGSFGATYGTSMAFCALVREAGGIVPVAPNVEVEVSTANGLQTASSLA